MLSLLGVRSFTDQQISEEQLKKLIHVANSAPISGGGFRDSARQLTVIKNTDVLKKIAEAEAIHFMELKHLLLYLLLKTPFMQNN